MTVADVESVSRLQHQFKDVHYICFKEGGATYLEMRLAKSVGVVTQYSTAGMEI